MPAWPDTVCLFVCVVAAWFDVRTYQIPNWLCALGGVAGLVLHAISGSFGLALAGGLFALIAAGSLGALRVLGMGDVKLLAAAGTLLAWPLAAKLLLYVAIAGGLFALVLIARRGVRPPLALRAPAASHRMPYGVAIALGVIWAIAARCLPALRLV